jgi:hypothetical protein
MKLTKKSTQAKCDRLYQKAAKYATEVDCDGCQPAIIVSWNARGMRIMRRVFSIA